MDGDLAEVDLGVEVGAAARVMMTPLHLTTQIPTTIPQERNPGRMHRERTQEQDRAHLEVLALSRVGALAFGLELLLELLQVIWRAIAIKHQHDPKLNRGLVAGSEVKAVVATLDRHRRTQVPPQAFPAVATTRLALVAQADGEIACSRNAFQAVNDDVDQ